MLVNTPRVCTCHLSHKTAPTLQGIPVLPPIEVPADLSELSARLPPSRCAAGAVEILRTAATECHAVQTRTCCCMSAPASVLRQRPGWQHLSACLIC